LNGNIEQDRRFIKKPIVAGLGFRSAQGDRRILGDASVIRKAQIRWLPKEGCYRPMPIHPQALRHRRLIVHPNSHPG
jgi:hypothetical protein